MKGNQAIMIEQKPSENWTIFNVKYIIKALFVYGFWGYLYE